MKLQTKFNAYARTDIPQIFLNIDISKCSIQFRPKCQPFLVTIRLRMLDISFLRTAHRTAVNTVCRVCRQCTLPSVLWAFDTVGWVIWPV